MADLTHVKGLDQIQAMLNTLPVKVEKNIMRGAMRAGMKVVQAEAKQNAPRDSGQLADGLKVGTRAKGSTVTATLKSTGKHAYLANWIEFGTRPHEIRPRKKLSLFIAGVFSEIVQHPGSRPQPFMLPALDSQASAAVIAAGGYIKQRLSKKEGLDTAHIMIEGDE